MFLKVLQIFFLVSEVTAVSDEPFVCESPVDLAFVLDTSSSIGIENFDQQIRFINDIIRLFDVGQQARQTKVAVVSYSAEIKIEFTFNTYNTEKDVLKAVDRIKYVSGTATRTYMGLQYTYEKIFEPGNGERPNVTNVVVVLTDGKTNAGRHELYWKEKGEERTQKQAAKIRELPAYLFAIGVGKKVDKIEIVRMASRPEFALFVDTYEHLNMQPIKNMLSRKICERPEKIPPECLLTRADVFFIVDESTSLRFFKNVKKELLFVASVIDTFDLERDKIRVGLMAFSTEPRMIFHLDDFKSKNEVDFIIKNQHEELWHGGDTHLEKALRALMNEGLAPSRGGRKFVRQIAVIITDGKSTVPRQTKRQLERLRENNVIVFAIGVGPECDREELIEIASTPNYMFEVDDVNGLAAIRKEVVTTICPE